MAPSSVALSGTVSPQAPVLIIGSGIAGLLTALKLAHLGVPCTVVTKSRLEHNSSWLAQGGIAAVLPDNPVDSVDAHVQDTLFAGAGLSEEGVVRSIVAEGAQAIEDLIGLGVPFDRVQGQLAFTKEAAHTQSRILHAGGDATGKSIQQTLIDHVQAHPLIGVMERCMVADLLVKDGRCYGAMVVGYQPHDPARPADDQPAVEPRLVLAPYTVLATGGIGQLYEHTTNPTVATGDGIALAYRAGARVQDMEFVQFHPTAFWAQGQVQFLISEALRGEGGLLFSQDSYRFALDAHPNGELAPRDVVTRAIYEQMKRDNAPYVWLDISHLPDEKIENRFPTILAKCAHFGVDIRRAPIPVAPAAHYGMGGVKVDDRGQTDIANLLAVGETVSTGLHGANRLASNSLLECAVIARRVAIDIAQQTENPALSTYGRWHHQQYRLDRMRSAAPPSNDLYWAVQAFRAVMWRHVGVVRDADQLQRALAAIDEFWSMGEAMGWFESVVQGIEFRNMLMTGRLIAQGALERSESRGAHYRTDCTRKLPKAQHSQDSVRDQAWAQEHELTVLTA